MADIERPPILLVVLYTASKRRILHAIDANPS